MILDITIQADSDNPSDMTALAALIASLGGRAHVILPTPVERREYAVDHSDKDEATIAASLAATDKPVPSGSTDSTGLPWDKRIHSDPPSTTQDGKWRKRRGVDETTVAAVTAELTGGGTFADAVARSEGDDTPLPPATPAQDTPDVPPPPVDTASGTAAVTTAADTNTAGGGARFANFGQFVAAVQKDKPGAVYAKLNEHAATLGAPDFKGMKDRPELWELFYDSFEG